MKMVGGVPVHTLAELRREGRPPFRVPGLVHRDLTGIVGVPYTGKSALAASLAMGVLGGSFLGREWDTAPDRVLIVCADLGTHFQMAERLAALGMPDDCEAVAVASAPPANAQSWRDLKKEFALTSDSLVIVDNLTASISDINDSKAVKAFFDDLRAGLLASGGMAVVVVHHMSEKAPSYGPARLQPLGSTAISAAFRHVVYVTAKREGVLELVTRGNDLASPEVLSVQVMQGVEAPAGFEVTDEALVSERTQRRQKETMDQRADMADWVVAHCQGKSKGEVARALATRFGGAVGTHEKNLQPSRALGQMLEVDEGRWARASAAA